MKVGRFFVEGGGDGGTIDAKGEVHEVDLVGEGAHNPSEAVVFRVHCLDVRFPGGGVRDRVCDGPYAKNVVDKPLVEDEVWDELGNKLVLTEGIKYVCPLWCWLGTHGST
jgi:hypothetical protein